MTKDLLGVFDMESTTVSKTMREFLSKAQKTGKVESVGGDIPRAIAITAGKKVYLSPSPTATLKRRAEK